MRLRIADKIGIIGPNGCGKTTLLKLFNGAVRPDNGRVSINGRTLGEVGEPAEALVSPRLSPDVRRVAVSDPEGTPARLGPGRFPLTRNRSGPLPRPATQRQYPRGGRAGERAGDG